MNLCQSITVILLWISQTPIRVPGRGLVSVYQFSLVISNPRYLTYSPFSSELGYVIGRELVSVYHRNFTLDISNPRAASPGGDLCQCISNPQAVSRGLVSVYHRNFTLDISNPQTASPGGDFCHCITVILPWGVNCVSVSL